MNFRDLPKIELHVHLDCCLSYDVVKKIDPEIDYLNFKKKFQAGFSSNSLSDYIKCADNAINLMQNKLNIELVIDDFFDQLKYDNVIYCEIRFAPLLHLENGLNGKEVVRIVCNSVSKNVKRTGIIAGIILCTLRHYSNQESMQTVKLAKMFKNNGVVGFDLAADEAGYSLNNHVSAFNYAKENNINCTTHAGEAKGSESIWESIEKLKTKRIGHGVRCLEDKKLISYLKEKDYHLEICISSNIKTKTFNKIEDHPISDIYNSSISLSINTDGRTISDTNLTKEYEIISSKFNWSTKDFKQCNLEAIKYSFTSDKVKSYLIDIINHEYV
tara:strand:+ start:173 stop:1159 length:987 start_codon:yes stop_codon:yes gene_type:complete